MADPGHGALSYAEIPVDDIERAKAFYEAVFGWTYQDHPSMKYTFFDSGEGGVGGGLAPRQSHSPPHPLHYVMCTDLPATLEHILSNGGTVVTSATEFGDAGWLAHVTDTEGNLFGLWQVKLDA